MNAQLHPIMATALASAVDVAARLDENESNKAAYDQMTKVCHDLTEKVIPNLRAENAGLREELRRAVGECCNQYWDDGHAERVQRLYGIDLEMLKVLGNAL